MSNNPKKRGRKPINICALRIFSDHLHPFWNDKDIYLLLADVGFSEMSIKSLKNETYTEYISGRMPEKVMQRLRAEPSKLVRVGNVLFDGVKLKQSHLCELSKKIMFDLVNNYHLTEESLEYTKLNSFIDDKEILLFFINLVSWIIRGELFDSELHEQSKTNLSPIDMFARANVSVTHINQFINFTLENGMTRQQSIIALYYTVEIDKSGADNPLFNYELGNLYYQLNCFCLDIDSDINEELSYQKAYDCFDKAAKHNYSLALWALGQMYENNKLPRLIKDKYQTPEDLVRKACDFYKQALPSCMQAKNNFGKLLLRAVWCYYSEPEKNNFSDVFSNVGAKSYTTIYNVMKDTLEFLEIIESSDRPRKELRVSTAEKLIINAYIEPAYRAGYVFAGNTIAAVYENRLINDPAILSNKKQMMEFYYKTALTGEPWSKRNYAFKLERYLNEDQDLMNNQLVHSRTDRKRKLMTDFRPIGELQTIETLYRDAVFKCPTDGGFARALYELARFHVEYPVINQVNTLTILKWFRRVLDEFENYNNITDIYRIRIIRIFELVFRQAAQAHDFEGKDTASIKDQIKQFYESFISYQKKLPSNLSDTFNKEIALANESLRLLKDSERIFM